MQNFFYRMAAAMQRFMYGRNGSDSLNKALFAAYFIIYFLNTLIFARISSSVYTFFRLFSLALSLIFLFRFFSRNLAARRAENEKWLLHYAKIQRKTGLMRQRWANRKTYYYKKCPKCKSVIRLKRIKGKHKVDCPKCGKELKVHIWF